MNADPELEGQLDEPEDPEIEAMVSEAMEWCCDHMSNRAVCPQCRVREAVWRLYPFTRRNKLTPADNRIVGEIIDSLFVTLSDYDRRKYKEASDVERASFEARRRAAIERSQAPPFAPDDRRWACDTLLSDLTTGGSRPVQPTEADEAG